MNRRRLPTRSDSGPIRDGCGGGGDGAERNHEGDGVGIVGDRVVDEDVQVQILDCPGDLSDEADDDDCQPDPSSQGGGSKFASGRPGVR